MKSRPPRSCQSLTDLLFGLGWHSGTAEGFAALTAREIERLMDAARKSSRWGHRDATMILIGYRHGLQRRSTSVQFYNSLWCLWLTLATVIRVTDSQPREVMRLGFGHVGECSAATGDCAGCADCSICRVRNDGLFGHACGRACTQWARRRRRWRRYDRGCARSGLSK